MLPTDKTIKIEVVTDAVQRLLALLITENSTRSEKAKITTLKTKSRIEMEETSALVLSQLGP